MRDAQEAARCSCPRCGPCVYCPLCGELLQPSPASPLSHGPTTDPIGRPDDSQEDQLRSGERCYGSVSER